LSPTLNTTGILLEIRGSKNTSDPAVGQRARLGNSGAGGGTRTLTTVRSGAFETPASAGPPLRRVEEETDSKRSFPGERHLAVEVRREGPHDASERVPENVV